MEGGENGTGEEVGLLVLEAKSLRPFKTKDEYLYAMKEDLAEWFKCLYEDIFITAENFLEVLETGVLLCQHSNEVRKFVAEQKEKGDFQMKSNFVRNIQIPQYDVQFRIDVKPETFLARDNVSNFITWTVKMGIPEVLRFETDDLVMRKNERSVVLCLLEVARVGAKFGMLAPTIVQMEEEIDEEIATGESPPQIKTCDIKSLDEMVRELVGRCTCPVQFPIIKMGEGKYKIGDSKTLVFVRILRKHVMIRVGGGWDTLEHYLDKHDPCQCNFQGHRQGGRGPSTPRRASTAGIAQTQPTTPRTPRRLSVTSNVNPPPSQSTQGHSNIRSASPGPNSKKLPLNRSNSQPGSALTSPDGSVKSPNLSSTGTFLGMSKNAVSNISKSRTSNSAQSTNSPRSVKSVSNSGPTNTRRSASPIPGVRRSESPAPEAINRLRSPSPAPSSSKNTPGTRTQSVPASVAKRCASPVKQITMSELRSSREGKPGLQMLRRQTSVDSTGDVDNDGSLDKKSSETGIAIDKISTMSLGEFKSLLNSALSVPHTAGSQCSSDSPRSQSSVDSTRNNSLTQNRKTAANKSVHTYKPGGANRTISNMEKSNTLPRTKSASLDCSSSGYSSSSLASDKSKKSSANSYSPTTNSASPTYARTSVSRPKTPSSDSPKVSRAVTSKSNLSNKQSVYSSTGVSSSPRSQTKQQGSAYKTRSQSSLNSDTSNRLNTASVPSRSSSQSSFKSYDSINEEDPYDPSDLRSVNSDNYLPKYNGALDSPSAVNYISNGLNHVPTNYTRSNSYTPSAAAADKAKWAEPRNETRANSEPREVVKSEPMSDMQPLNVGYASFSHQEQNVNSPGILSPTYKFDEELSKIESELKKYENNDDDISDEMNFHEEKSVSKTHSVASQLPIRRPSTPSLIPRPATPKMTRKLSLTQGDEEYAVAKQTDNKGRPPTPKKSNIIARANSGTSSLKATDSSKEKTYKDIFQSKRSTTPGPGNVSTNPVTDNARRCTTPGPTMSRTSSLSTTSATVSRDRLNQTLEKNRDAPLSVFDDSKNSGQSVKAKTNSGGVIGRRHSVDSRSFNKESSSKEPETVIMVNRSGDGHSLTVKDQAKPPTKPSANRPNVLARARTEDARSRPQTRTNTGISRQRPQSVEPRQLIPRSKNTSDANEQNGALSVHRGEDGNHSIYNRTQEWVQTAVEQTSKVQKTKVMKQVNPKVRRAMTPNSFHKRIDQEEPRSLDEIKAALTLPINGLTKIEIDAENLDAPPEDPEMYATMEKLFNELRKQELKASVNETPGSNVTPAKSSKSKSKSSGSMNDEEASLDSNKNIKHKKLSLSTSSSNVTSPTVPQKKASVNSNVSQPSYGRQPSRTSSTSSVSANPSTSASRSTQPSTPRSTPPRATPPRTASTPRSDPPRPASPSRNMSAQPQRPSSPSMNRSVQPQRPSSPSMNRSAQPARPSSPSMNRSAQPARPSSPSMNRSAQPARPSSPSMNRSAQPARPSSPSMNTPAQPPRPSSPSMNRSFQSPRPASPRTTVSAQPSKPPVQRPASPRTTSTQSSRSSVPASPRSQPESKVSCTQQSTSPQTPRQPPRPASTPPRPSTPVGRTSSSRARDDTESSQNNGTVAASSLLSKIKEIIKVKPRKDKAEGVKQKSRIPAPKSLANAGKSRSFTNLGSIGRSMTLPNTKANGHLDYSDFDGDMNGMDYESDINGGLNVTMSGRNETPKLKMAMPLTTGRATVIRKESIEKNRNPPRLTRAVSVERNMGGLASDFQFYREGEYV